MKRLDKSRLYALKQSIMLYWGNIQAPVERTVPTMAFKSAETI
jgi:hypothetical protein